MSDLQRTNEIFDRAAAIPDARQRAAYLDEACGDDAELRKHIESLLRFDALDETPLDAEFDDLVGALLDADESDPERIGAYRVERELGRGGMGTVYLAHRDDGAFEQQVAIKVVKRGMDTDEILARFAGERRILARLEHPGIARLLDGGALPDGRPYLVMEYVDGVRITDFARERGAGIDQRLALFRQAADAVRFAHRSLVVHRDLKPSNVLVSGAAGSQPGRVKLLDFGIAKVLEGDPEQEADLTREGSRAFTPTYAAPEQTAGARVTTGFDVYSLGVILHELLTGHKPVWRHGDAVAPSTVVSTVSTKPKGMVRDRESGDARSASSSGLPPDHVRERLKGDLDAIIMRAVAHDPEQRYPTVDALVDDLDRCAAGLPVSARRATAGYRFRRFVGRNRVSVGAAAAVLAALGLGLLSTQRERARAEAERDATLAVTSFLEGVFASANPVGATLGADTLRIGDVLDRSVAQARGELAGQPALQARMLETFGRAYFALGDFEQADALWQDERTVHAGEGAPLPTRLLTDLGAVSARMQRWERADSLLAQAVDRARVESDDAAAARALAVAARAHLDRRSLEEAESVLAELLPLARSVGDTSLLAEALFMEGGLRVSQGDPASAEAPLSEGIDLYRGARGATDPQVAIGSLNLAAIARSLGNLDSAREHGQRGLSILERRMPADHPTTLAALNGLAATLDVLNELQTADSLYSLAAERAAGPGRENVLIQVYFNHAANRRRAADTTRALELSLGALDVARRAGGGAQLANPLLGVARAYEFAGDTTVADRFYREAADVYRASAPVTYPGRIVADRGVASGHSRAGRHVQAERAMLEVLERTPEGADPGSAIHRARLATLEALVDVYRRWGRSDDAARVEAMRRQEAGSS